MTTSLKDGYVNFIPTDEAGRLGMSDHWGLTRRELFAAMAMQGMCAGYTKLSDDPLAASVGIIRNQPASIAELSVLYADCLLDELGKRT